MIPTEGGLANNIFAGNTNGAIDVLGTAYVLLNTNYLDCEFILYWLK